MSDTATTYQDLIKEAFIDPIRTVTVIDDEYPTLQELLLKPEQAPSIDNPNIARLINITRMCHETHKWSLDVFNGKSPRISGGSHIPEHLHHSDLLVLDYQLDGDEDVTGDRAREIIKTLDGNSHFNIVLVHTNRSSADIKNVFEQVLSDFCVFDNDIFSPIKDKEDVIDEWLDQYGENLESWLRAEYSIVDIASSLSKENINSLNCYKAPKHIFNQFSEDIDNIVLKEDDGFSVDELILFKLRDLVDKNSLKVGLVRDDLSWGWNDDDVNYISTGKVFISIVKKSSEDPEHELLSALRNSLNNFNASPMHLLMAKIRHEIDDRGLEQAQSILQNRPAQAGWLYGLLSNNKDSLAHDKAIDLHWEQLGRASKNSLREFSRRLVDSLVEDDNRKVVKRFFRECIRERELSCGHLNAFSCSMPVTGTHLNTGTVLSIDGEIWVCLSPACDLVPDQKASQWSARIGVDHLAFKAVLLHEGVNLSTANGKANSNEYIYLNLDPSVEPKVFSYSEGESPTWDTFYALNQGRFSDGNSIALDQVRENEGSLSINNVEAIVVAELRYEYALNLLQRLGANQTRVGLDFIQKNSLWG